MSKYFTNINTRTAVIFCDFRVTHVALLCEYANSMILFLVKIRYLLITVVTLRPVHTSAMHMQCATRKLQTYFLLIRVYFDKTANARCTVAATACGEPNFVGILREHKDIVVRSVDVFLVLNSCSQTKHLIISLFKNTALRAFEDLC